MNTSGLPAVALALAAVVCLGGCMTDLTSHVEPQVDLADFRTYYVQRHEEDERGVEKMIATHLLAMGKTASYGDAPSPARAVDVIVRYDDKWYWDITMYMIGLTIEFHNPRTDALLAVGESRRTSLARKTPEGMVEEVLTEMFGEQ